MLASRATGSPFTTLRCLGNLGPWNPGLNNLASKPQWKSRPTLIPVRHATHGAQGRANGPKNGPGKRLGAKKTGDQYVIPGNIIYRQRGTLWYPGANVGMGRDHTLFALETGYVKFYRNPRLHPKRKYIGVTFERDETLPKDPTAPRRRRLGMVAVPRPSPTGEDDAGSGFGIVGGASEPVTAVQAGVSKKIAKKRKRSGRLPHEQLQRSQDYGYRESNWQIGRAAERAGVKVREYIPGDRFKAWRKRSERRRIVAEKKSMVKKKGSARKGKKAK